MEKKIKKMEEKERRDVNFGLNKKMFLLIIYGLCVTYLSWSKARRQWPGGTR